ncbi:unnamed protein product, partial [Phaeothamnion confervicola]
LEAGLPLSAAEEVGEGGCPAVLAPGPAGAAARQAALHMLVCMAEGKYVKPKGAGGGRSKAGGSAGGAAVSPMQLLHARMLLADHVRREATALGAAPGVVTGALDCTPALFYYAAAFAWLQALSMGLSEAQEAIRETVQQWPAPVVHGTEESVLDMPRPAGGGSADGATLAAGAAIAPGGGDGSGSGGGGGGDDEAAKAKEEASASSLVAWGNDDGWRMAATEGAAAVGLERFHGAACELLYIATKHGRQKSGGGGLSGCQGSPAPLRAALRRALRDFPLSPALLAVLVANEQ